MTTLERRQVWDLPTRIFHWALALSLLGSWFSAEGPFDLMEWHFYFGYVAIGLVAFRLIWGVFGTRHARFASFLRGPSKVLSYAKTFGSSQPSTHVGHNPMGGWMVLVMLIAVGVQAGSGLFITDDVLYTGPYNGAVSGELAGRLSYVHDINFTILQCLVALHLLAILFYWQRKRTNLVLPMLTGHKASSSVPETEAITTDAVLRGLFFALLVAAGVFALVWFAPPPAPIDFF